MRSSYKRRLERLEAAIEQRRDDLLDRIVSFVKANMGSDECAALAASIRRHQRDGERAQYTEAELAAAWRFDALLTERPDIGQSMDDLAKLGGGNGKN